MRLIDADKLHEDVEFHVTSVSVCATAEQARGMTKFKLRCLEDIDNAETVPAIAIEWLKAQQGKFAAKGDPIIAETICFLIRLWEMEQHKP